MSIVKPKRLKSGDLIGVISPASSPDDLIKIENGVKYLEKLGYRVLVGKNVGKVNGYLAGSDQERVDDLHDMFKNKNVNAVFCVRGGYGSTRLLDKIDYKLIANNPKIFVGYSDINALQMAFYAKCGLITFGGPMVAVDFANEISPFTEEAFWKVLTSNTKIGRVQNPNKEKYFILNKGKAEGRILGGNLSIINSLIGTEYLPKLKDSILLLEEINEEPYRIDRMLNHLRLLKILKSIRGIILGDFVKCVEFDSEKRTLSLNEVITDYFEGLKMPVIYNFRHGHLHEKVTIPFGVRAVLNASRGYVEINENAVT
jgi:muramoyltetrapeptide carboxypeptidase